MDNCKGYVQIDKYVQYYKYLEKYASRSKEMLYTIRGLWRSHIISIERVQFDMCVVRTRSKKVENVDEATVHRA